MQERLPFAHGPSKAGTSWQNASPPAEQNRCSASRSVSARERFRLMAAMISSATRGVSTPELAFYRFAFGLRRSSSGSPAKNFGAWRTQRPMAHVVRAAIGLGTMVLAFSALAYLPLAESTTIGFVAPFFAVMISALVLKEPVGKHRWSAVLLGFLGVLIVMRPESSHLPLEGLALAVAAAFGVGVVTITIRQIGRTEGTQTTVLWFSLLSMLVLSPLLPFFAKGHDTVTWGILAALGLFGGFGQLFLTASLRFAPVPVVVPFDYSQLLWAVLLGWWLFETRPPASTWAGAAVIVASGLYTVYREHRLGRDQPKDATSL
jgi:drug/metabolite transporter (DMT)-like permease